MRSVLFKKLASLLCSFKNYSNNQLMPERDFRVSAIYLLWLRTTYIFLRLKKNSFLLAASLSSLDCMHRPVLICSDSSKILFRDRAFSFCCLQRGLKSATLDPINISSSLAVAWRAVCTFRGLCALYCSQSRNVARSTVLSEGN